MPTIWARWLIACGRCSAPDGLFFFEAQYLLDIIDGVLIATIFHEHMSHHSVKPMVQFLDRHGLELIAVERARIQHGSLIGTVQLKGGRRPVEDSVQQLLALEVERQLGELQTLREFDAKVKQLRDRTASLWRSGKARGHDRGLRRRAQRPDPDCPARTWPARSSTLSTTIRRKSASTRPETEYRSCRRRNCAAHAGLHGDPGVGAFAKDHRKQPGIFGQGRAFCGPVSRERASSGKTATSRFELPKPAIDIRSERHSVMETSTTKEAQYQVCVDAAAERGFETPRASQQRELARGSEAHRVSVVALQVRLEDAGRPQPRAGDRMRRCIRHPYRAGGGRQAHCYRLRSRVCRGRKASNGPEVAIRCARA